MLCSGGKSHSFKKKSPFFYFYRDSTISVHDTLEKFQPIYIRPLWRERTRSSWWRDKNGGEKRKCFEPINSRCHEKKLLRAAASRWLVERQKNQTSVRNAAPQARVERRQQREEEDRRIGYWNYARHCAQFVSNNDN